MQPADRKSHRASKNPIRDKNHSLPASPQSELARQAVALAQPDAGMVVLPHGDGVTFTGSWIDVWNALDRCKRLTTTADQKLSITLRFRNATRTSMPLSPIPDDHREAALRSARGLDEFLDGVQRNRPDLGELDVSEHWTDVEPSRIRRPRKARPTRR